MNDFPMGQGWDTPGNSDTRTVHHETRRTIVRTGLTFGSILAMILSFTVNKSVIWAIIHSIFSWVYVIYRAVAGGY